MSDLVLVMLSYVIGSILNGIIIAKIAGLGNLRKQGSGNVGATNVTRIGGKKLGIITAILDCLKGWIAVYITQNFAHSGYIVALAGYMVVVGHVFSIFDKFNGGKGVATSIGVFFALDWHLCIVAITIWLILFLLFKISSLSSLVSIFCTAVVSYFTTSRINSLFITIIALLIIYTHRSNIILLLHRSEKPIPM
ncbi:Glycerol-3-phosphate acyltransferase [Alphaproteobacteria bacterium]